MTFIFNLTFFQLIFVYCRYFAGLKCIFDDCSKTKRQQEIMKKYQYLCECPPCVENYPMKRGLLHLDPSFKMPKKSFGSFKKTKEELAQNWKYLTAKMENHPSLETSGLLGRNRDLLDHLKKLACSSYGNM